MVKAEALTPESAAALSMASLMHGLVRNDMRSVLRSSMAFLASVWGCIGSARCWGAMCGVAALGSRVAVRRAHAANWVGAGSSPNFIRSVIAEGPPAAFFVFPVLFFAGKSTKRAGYD